MSRFHILEHLKIYASKKLQLLGELVPQTPYRGFAPGPSWGFRPRPLAPIVQNLNLSLDVGL